jgi:hypothetical protein
MCADWLVQHVSLGGIDLCSVVCVRLACSLLLRTEMPPKGKVRTSQVGEDDDVDELTVRSAVLLAANTSHPHLPFGRLVATRVELPRHRHHQPIIRCREGRRGVSVRAGVLWSCALMCCISSITGLAQGYEGSWNWCGWRRV